MQSTVASGAASIGAFVSHCTLVLILLDKGQNLQNRVLSKARKIFAEIFGNLVFKPSQTATVIMGMLTKYAKTILESAQAVEEYFEKNDLPPLHFDEDGPPGIPPLPELQAYKLQLETAVFELQLLAGGPSGLYSQGLLGVRYSPQSVDSIRTF